MNSGAYTAATISSTKPTAFGGEMKNDSEGDSYLDPKVSKICTSH